MFILRALVSFILRIFGIKPKINYTSTDKKLTNVDDIETGIGGGTNSSKSEEDLQEEAKLGIWAFLKNIIEMVERKFSRSDHEEVQMIGRSLNQAGAKFLGEIKVGKSARAMNQALVTQQTKGKQQFI